MNKSKKQRTADKNVTKNIFSDTSSQDRNTFYLKGKLLRTHLMVATNKERPTAGPLPNFPLREVQRTGLPTLPSTLETLLLTERIEAIAATAINETISVYSIAVAP